MSETSLKQAKSKVVVEGILSSKELEETNDKGKKAIKGKMNIKVDDTNTITFRVYTSQLKNDGTENRAWAGMQTVMNEYKSIAEVGEENADRVHVNGQFNTYRTQDGKEVATYQSNFFTRLSRPLDPKREFSAEIFVKSVSPEVNADGEETGRLKIKGISPNYNGIDILEIFVPEDLASDVENVIEVGGTTEVWGDIVNARVEKKIPVAIGKPKTETSFVNELVLTGMSEMYSEERAYDSGAIQLAIQEYETNQANRANKTSGSAEPVPFKNKPTATGTGRALGF